MDTPQDFTISFTFKPPSGGSVALEASDGDSHASALIATDIYGLAPTLVLAHAVEQCCYALIQKRFPINY